MAGAAFGQRLSAAIAERGPLCLGIDPHPELLARWGLGVDADGLAAFASTCVRAFAGFAIVKPQVAFFEAYGAAGFAVLEQTIAGLSESGVLVLADAKRGDIGSTAEAYARLAFDLLGADAVTLNPYLGGDALAPFLRYADRGCFVLCKTSNPGSGDVQDLELASGGPLYLEVARSARERWNANGNVGLVVGATHPGAIAAVRAACPDLPLLVPGVGAQGGELAAAVRAAVDASGQLALINASRSVLFASNGEDFAYAARQEAERLRDAINAARGAC